MVKAKQNVLQNIITEMNRFAVGVLELNTGDDIKSYYNKRFFFFFNFYRCLYNLVLICCIKGDGKMPKPNLNNNKMNSWNAGRNKVWTTNTKKKSRSCLIWMQIRSCEWFHKSKPSRETLSVIVHICPSARTTKPRHDIITVMAACFHWQSPTFLTCFCPSELQQDIFVTLR